MDYDRDLTWVENLKIQSYSEHPEVKTAADILTSAFYQNKSRKRDQKGFARDARKLIASLWLHEQALFKFTTMKAHFEVGIQGKRKQVWMTKRVLQLFNTARDIGWIVLYRKGIAPQLSKSGKGLNSVYRTTEHFYNLLTHLKHEDILPDTRAPRVELKSDEDVLQTLPDSFVQSDDCQQTVSVLEKHYELLQDTRVIKESGKPVPLSHLYFVRKFKPNMSKGGRIYAQFQNYPKKERLGITINNEPVCSLDISQLHPQLLLRFFHKRDCEDLGLFAYARGDDIYTMLDYPGIPRAVHKKLINTLFNAKSLDSAIRALMSTHYWQCEETGKWKSETYRGKRRRKGQPVLENPSKETAQAYIDSFKQNHPLLAPALCSGLGSHLQAADGRMMLTVLRYHNNVALPVIPIHDEIIVPETKATMEFAEIALKDAFRETFGAEGSFGSIYAKWSFGEGKEDKTVEIKLGE
jgi:hypothetical protein